MTNPVEQAGFSAPPQRALGRESRTAVLAEVVAIAGLVISTLIAATVVTVGIAHASVADTVVDNDGGLFAIALLLGLLFIGVGGFSLLPHNQRRHRH